jgi:heme/copper-type cytochrome/quinol oxidase subunit 2
MRLVTPVMCAVLAAGVVVTTLLAIWSTRRARTIPIDFRQRLREELVWAAIPCLMVLATAIPVAAAVASARSGD